MKPPSIRLALELLTEDVEAYLMSPDNVHAQDNIRSALGMAKRILQEVRPSGAEAAERRASDDRHRRAAA
jgi:hypothetical protein